MSGGSQKEWVVQQAVRRIRERYPLRSHIAANYLCEMRASFEQTLKALKPGGYFVLVAGNNRVCGYNFQTKTYLTSILESQGLSLILELADDIQSRGLMTKRNQTASVITRESVLLFRN